MWQTKRRSRKVSGDMSRLIFRLLAITFFLIPILYSLTPTPAYSQDDGKSRIREGYEKRTIEGINFVLPEDVRVYDKGGVMVRESDYEYTYRKFNETNTKLEELRGKYDSLEERVNRLENIGR